MNITVAQLNGLRQSLIDTINVKFDTLIANPDTFLEELESIPVKTPYEAAAEYEVTVIASAPPNMDGIEPLTETLKEKLDLVPVFKQDESWELIKVGEERHSKILEWIILKKATLEDLQNFMEAKKVRFQEKEFEHLKNVVWYRQDDDAFNLKLIFSQKDTTEAEKEIWKKSDKK